jgi:predicted MPP superfamily phosphohydrolase
MIAGGLLLSFGIFVIILSGIFIGRKTIRVVPVTIQLKDLPEQMDGMTIAQISDIHLGSYSGDKSVIESTVRKIQEINPDLFVFTGDIVNNFCREITGYEKLLSQLSGKYGKFAILGNHDYGDIFSGPTAFKKYKIFTIPKLN